jgi:hypothetical protein
MDYVVWRLAEKNSGKPDAMLMRINQLGAERSSEVTVMARSLLPSLDGGDVIEGRNSRKDNCFQPSKTKQQ